MNKSFNRMAMNGGAYTPAEADAVIDQWTDIAKGLVDRDLRSIQRDLTSKCNSRSPVVFPDEFINSREVAYRVASVVTKELMQRKQRQSDDHLQKIRSEYAAKRSKAK